MGIKFGDMRRIFADRVKVGPMLFNPATGHVGISISLEPPTWKEFVCLKLGIKYRRKVRWRNILKFRMETDPWR